MRLPEVLDARPEVGEARVLVARGLRELPFSLRGHEPADERALRDVERLRERVVVVQDAESDEPRADRYLVALLRAPRVRRAGMYRREKT